ncbi:unnamed protein product, partial [Didymodactylos carnosus]
MHEPFITTNQDQLVLFQKHFLQYSHLFPTELDTLKQKHALKTPVKIKSLSECPMTPLPSFHNADTLVVGGPPALITGVSMVKKDKCLTYINDERRIPIAFGSAWHLEQDAETEAPTSYRPTKFLGNQITRATVRYISHASVEQTGLFPWRTIDWIGWIRHPDHWLLGLKVTLAFQLVAMFDDRITMLKKVAAQCQTNEKFYEKLDQELDGKLLMREKGSIIVARNSEEVSELNTLKEALTIEGRTLKIISKEEMKNRYGFLPNGLMYGEKLHDRVLSSNFMRILSEYIHKQGGKVIDGTLTSVYADNQKVGGIAEYQTPDGQKNLLPFSRLILSLGSQPIISQNNKPLFDVVSARGISVLAHVYVPHGYQLPSVLVCGGTNH